MALPPAAAVGGAHNVFVYGSLMADEVVCAILKRVPPSSPALLPNYHRFNIKDRIYPAILPVEGKKVAGKGHLESPWLMARIGATLKKELKPRTIKDVG